MNLKQDPEWGIASRSYDRGDVTIAKFPEGSPTIAKVKRLAGNNWKHARLIAAAPELLKALKTAVQVMQDNNLDESLAGEFEQFTDAINQAEAP